MKVLGHSHLPNFPPTQKPTPGEIANLIHKKYFNSIGTIITDPEKFKENYNNSQNSMNALRSSLPFDVKEIDAPKQEKDAVFYYYRAVDGSPRKVSVDNLNDDKPSIHDTILPYVCAR